MYTGVIPVYIILGCFTPLCYSFWASIYSNNHIVYCFYAKSLVVQGIAFSPSGKLLTVEPMERNDQEYPSRALLTGLIGDSAKSKVLAVMLKEAHRDLSVKEIADLAGVHQSTAYEPLEELEEWGVVVESRQVANSTLYQLDKSDPIVKKLKQIEEELVDRVGSDLPQNTE